MAVFRTSWVLAVVGVLAAAVMSFAQGASMVAPVVDRVESVGAGIYEVAVGESTGEIYVASTGGAPRIVVLDPGSLAVRRTFLLAGVAPFGLAFNNRTRTLYTSNTTSSSVSAIDVGTGRVIASITPPDGGSAHVFRLLVDEAANVVYVSLPGTSSRIWIIDGATNTLRGEITGVGGRSTGLALDAAGRRLYTCSVASSEIIEIDLESRQIVRRFPSGGVGTTHLAIDGRTGRMFASHQRSGDVTVLDLRTGTVLNVIPTGAGALGIALDAARDRLYVANRQADTVSVIDVRTLAVVATLRGGSLPNTVAFDSGTGDAYVTFKSRAGSPDRVARLTSPSRR